MKIESLKIGQEVEISFSEAKELVAKTIGEYDFTSLNESTVDGEQSFETVQNRKYFATKIGKKGSKLYADSEHETKAKKGIFALEMTWDFRHPSNFCLNQNGLSRKFEIAI